MRLKILNGSGGQSCPGHVRMMSEPYRAVSSQPATMNLHASSWSNVDTWTRKSHLHHSAAIEAASTSEIGAMHAQMIGHGLDAV
jgi:hypothetical protein